MNNYQLNRPSSLDKRIGCTASGTVEQEFPEEETSLVAEKGIKLHKLLETGETPDNLDSDELWNLETARKQIKKLVSDLEEKTGEEVHIHKEMNVDIFLDFDKFTKGTADLVLVSKDMIVIIDYKSGRVKVDKTSYQLQAYALGVSQYFKASDKKIVIGICQPLCYKKIQIKTFDEQYAVESFRKLLKDQKNNPYHFNTGSHCKYCKFRTQCPALANSSKELVKVANEITAQQAPQFLEKYTLVKGVLDDAYKKVKELVSQGLVKGYEIKEIAGRKKCTDIEGVYKEWKDYIKPSEFMGLCDISSTEFIDFAKRRLKDIEDIKTLKDSELRVKKSIEPFMTTGKPSKKIVKSIKNIE